MKLDEITVKKDEYYTPPYAIEPILKYIQPRSKVWCPFDTEESLFVKMLRRQGHEVIATHIDNGGDFFTLDIPCDCIISNPPYSMKARLFPPNFFKWPVHLHHCHDTGMTIGAVHCYCNAVLWQHHGK